MTAKAPKLWVSNIILVTAFHAIALASLLWAKPKWQSVVGTLLIWPFAGLGITVGYHRLWSHRSFKARLPLRLFLAFLGTMAFQGSIRWWVKRHRLHHRFVDTENDPYNSKEGFWFSHIGWIFYKRDYRKAKTIDLSDLDGDWVVCLQHKYYPVWALICGFFVPYALSTIWDDNSAGLLYLVFVAKILIWHTTFSINSFAHKYGYQDYSLELSARGNLLLALITSGEGHHNFHHEFPIDYRNGVGFLDYDPSKWFIWIASKIGLAYDLRETSDEDISMALLDTQYEAVKELRSKFDWGPEDKDLETWTKEDLEEKIKLGGKYIQLDKYAIDVGGFVKGHPGGASIIDRFIGRDATVAFNGGSNSHSNSAKRLVKKLRAAIIA